MPELAGRKHIVALSGGKDSTAMALRLAEVEPRDYLYVCTPTSNELPEMFEHWRRLSELLGARILPVTGGNTLVGLIRKWKTLPNWRMRFCTRVLKIEPFQSFLLANLPAVSYVGIRADEMEREGVDHGELSTDIVNRYPLREWGWGLRDVKDYLAHRGVEIPARTDCAMCFFQTLGEWHRLWSEEPELYREAEELEEEMGHTLRSDSRDTWPAALKDLRAAFEAGRVPPGPRKMSGRKIMCSVCAR